MRLFLYPRPLWVMALILALGGGTATAQSPGIEREADRERSAAPARVVRDSRRAADAAELLRAGDGDVRYADVLAQPDDVELNFRWANQQVARGDLKGAASTLERMLLIDPSLTRVRLFYGIVLYRLDDLAGAERELGSLSGDASVAGTVHEYLGRIAKRREPSRVRLTVSGGGSYDSNRNSAPHSNSLLFSDFRVHLGGLADEDDDYAAIGLMELAFDRRIGDQEQHTLFGSLSAYNSDQKNLNRFDSHSVFGELGVLWRTQALHYRARLIGSMLDLSSEKFVRSVGAELSAERGVGHRLGLRGVARVESFDYDGIPGSRRAYERTGLETRIGAELGWEIDPRHRIAGALYGRHRSAQRRFYGYYGPTFRLQHTWLPGEGQFVIAEVNGEWNRYKDAQPIVSSKIRRDLMLRPRLVYGAPLSFFSRGLLSGGLGSILLSLSGEYTWVSSNLPNYTYDNLSVGFLLTKGWEF